VAQQVFEQSGGYHLKGVTTRS